MGELSNNTERIAAHLVGKTHGATVVPFDVGHRQGVVDFHLVLPCGDTAALEVTAVTDRHAMEWLGNGTRDVWRWPASGSWNYFPHTDRVSYRSAKSAAIQLSEWCDRAQVDRPEDLSPTSWLEASELLRLDLELAGGLYRSRARQEPGILVNTPTRIEIVDESVPTIPALLEEWLNLPHIQPHIDKLLADESVVSRHLFLVPLPDALPSTYLTDGFPPPTKVPRGYAGIEHLWLWSQYWHRMLHLGSEGWEWLAFPPV